MLREDHSLAPLSDLGSWPPLKRYMADDFVGRVPRDDGYELAPDDFCPVASRGKYFGVHIAMTIHLQEAAGDRGCI